jgi:AAA family ATP:ADP antiporter
MSFSIRHLLQKTFDIRPGEGRRAALMQLNIFLIISTLLIVKPTVNGLFLSEMGVEKLPIAFLLVAVFAILISNVYVRFLNQTTLNKLILSTLLLSVLLFLFFGVLLYLNVVGGWILYAFYIWVSLFGVLTASQFWILANVVFNAREAKRLFGFIGAGAIAGGIFGGYLTTLLAEWLGSEHLPFVAAGLLFFCIPITYIVWEKEVLPTQTKFQRRKKITQTTHPLRLILNSSHLTNLAAIIGISVIVARLVDYQFNAIASAKIEDPDELTAFFGLWFSNFNVISLVIQLLFTRKVVGVLGVGKSLFFLPGIIFLGAGLLLFIPELWVAVFIKLGDGSLKQSINKAAVELLALPIPVEVKNQTKTFIDVVVDSLATGIGGLILIFVVRGLDLSTGFISIIILVLVVGWLFFIWRVRKTYLQTFKLRVRQAQNNENITLELDNESVISDLKKVLMEGAESQILYVLKKLKNQPDSRFSETILTLLKHPSDAVKEEAIRNLYFLKNQNNIEVVRPFINYPSQRVKVAAFDYLIAFSQENRLTVMEHYLKDSDDAIKLAALVALAEESRDNPILKAQFDLENRLSKVYYDLGKITDNKQLNFHKIGFLKALGLAKTERLFPFIDSFFQDPNEQVVRQAISSAGDTLHPFFIDTLIRFLSDSRFIDSASLALHKYGPDIVRVLSNYIQSPDTPTEIINNMPLVLERFGRQEATDLLFALLQNENATIRLGALRSLNQQKIKFPYLNFYETKVLPYLVKEAHMFQDILTILYVQRNAAEKQLSNDSDNQKKLARQHLIQLLEARLDSNLERIFRLLGLKYPPTDVIDILENIQSPQPDLRQNALEYLDNLLEPNLKKVLIPIVETALLDSISVQALQNLNIEVPNEQESFQSLLLSDDKELKSAAEELLNIGK